MSSKTQLRFGSSDWRLFGNALNEVINGFAVPDFERTIGASKEHMIALLKRLNNLDNSHELEINVQEARNISNALRQTIRELGVEEFHTRTGYHLDEGEAILKRLNELILGASGGWRN